MQKILVVTTRPLEANLSCSIRKISTIRSLVDIGAEVTVLSTEIPRNPDLFNNKVDLGNAKTITLQPGPMYNAGVTKYGNNKNDIRRKIKLFLRNSYYKTTIFDPLKSCIKYVDTLKGKLESNYDYIISISDPKSSHLLAIALLNKQIVSCNKYIQIWGDPMYLDITNNKIIPRSIIRKNEEKLLSYPDKIFYVSPLTLKEEKILFPQFSNKMDILFPTYQQERRYSTVTKIKRVGYFGDYNSNIRDIMPLYNAIKSTKYNLIICGHSDLILDDTNNIKINKRVPFKEVNELEGEVDLLVHISNKSGSQIPGKIYQYLGTNKPILFILDGPKELLKQVFEPYNRIFFCNNNSNEIKKTIERFNNGELTVSLEPIKDFSNGKNALKILQ